MANPRTDDNDGIHIERIIGAQVCEKHEAGLGTPCWTVWSAHGRLKAICNHRALSYGARGKVTPYERPSTHNSKKKEYSR